MDKELIKLICLVQRSSYRKKILESLKDKKIKRPSHIAKETNMSLPHTSRYLTELRKHGLIELLNEEEKYGRLFRITSLGLEILDYI